MAEEGRKDGQWMVNQEGCGMDGLGREREGEEERDDERRWKVGKWEREEERVCERLFIEAVRRGEVRSKVREGRSRAEQSQGGKGGGMDDVDREKERANERTNERACPPNLNTH